MRNIPELVKNKLIQCGNIIEIYKYEKGYLKGYTLNSDSSGGRVADYTSDNYEEHREQVLKRAKRDLRRLINSNHGQYGDDMTSKFMTLTFRESVTDLSQANYEWKKFMQRLNYEVFKVKKSNLRYNVVIEYQKRGAIHYHAIFYNLPYVKQKRLMELWDNGGVNIKKIDNVDNVGAYIGEYLGDAEKKQGKELGDSRLKGRKSYFSSRGLFKPLEITDKKKIEAVQGALPVKNKIYSAQFNNEHLGNISYSQYNLNK